MQSLTVFHTHKTGSWYLFRFVFSKFAMSTHIFIYDFCLLVVQLSSILMVLVQHRMINHTLTETGMCIYHESGS